MTEEERAAAETKEHALGKIHTMSTVHVSIDRDKEHAHYATGLFTNDLYRAADHRAMTLGLMKTAEARNTDRFADSRFNEERPRRSTDDDLFKGADKFTDGGGDLFLSVAPIGPLLSGIGNTMNSSHRVDARPKGLIEGITEVLAGTILSLLPVFLNIIFLAVICLLIYERARGSTRDRQCCDITKGDPPLYEGRKRTKLSFD